MYWKQGCVQKDEGLMCIFQYGSGLKEGVEETSKERLKRCMDGLMLFLTLNHEGKVCCSRNLPINCFHCLFGDLPAVGGKCQIMKTYPLEKMLFLVGLWPKPSTQLLLHTLTKCSGTGKSCRNLHCGEQCSKVQLVLRLEQRLLFKPVKEYSY